jgi:DNA ligase-associated metallophosphoesterase
MIRTLIAGEPMELLPERALLWAGRRMLLVADTHLGKGTVFRARGIPVPAGSTSEDLARLGTLITRHRPDRLVVLGDFLHAEESRDDAVLEALGDWRAGFPQLQVTIVRGNHDLRAGDVPSDLGFETVAEPLLLGPFALAHYPDAREGSHTIGGHLHPAVKWRFGRNAPIRAAAFVVGERRTILPAFGSFTGLAEMDPALDDRLYICNAGLVAELPRPIGRTRRTPSTTIGRDTGR